MITIKNINTNQGYKMLDAKLQNLQRYGCPRLSYVKGVVTNKSGWVCYIDLNIKAKGGTFDMRSEFNHNTPTEAVDELTDRVSALINDISSFSIPQNNQARIR